MNKLMMVCFLVVVMTVSLMADHALKVVVSIAPHASFVEEIAGSFIESQVLIPANSDPHRFQVSAKQMAHVSDSDLFVCAGLPFENIVINKMKDHTDARFLHLNEHITKMTSDHVCHGHEHHHHHEHESWDPHTWLNPENAIQQIEDIVDVFIELEPEHAAVFREKGHLLIAQIVDLDRSIADKLSHLKGARVFVYHPAWAYFCNRYGLEQVAVEVDGKQPSAKHLTRLFTDHKQSCLPVILVQPQANKKMIRSIAEELKLEVVEADPMSGDYIKNLESLVTVLSQFQSS